MNSIDTRRSIRKYAHRDVSDELLQSMLAHAEHTQTMGNLQLYSVVATRDAELKKRLAPAHFNQPMVTEAPVVLTFCADFRRTTVWAENRKATPGYDNFLSFINAATDALLFCQTFCNIADEQGLGYCFLGTTIYDPQTIIDVLKLPKLVMPVLARRGPGRIRQTASESHTPQRDIPRLYSRRHRRILQGKGSTAGKPPFCRDKQQGNACTGVHRLPLYKTRQRGDVGRNDRSSQASGIFKMNFFINMT